MEIAFASRVRRGDSTTSRLFRNAHFLFFCSASASALKLAKLNFLYIKKWLSGEIQEREKGGNEHCFFPSSSVSCLGRGGKGSIRN